ncbi:hypothetical protein L1887_20459 [Cichorium endivia]|nr:hypothetical protein L1887_20459 [Cichorium endivia]
MESDKTRTPSKINPLVGVKKRSERILKKTAFSKFKNTESNPVVLDSDIDSGLKESYQPSVPRVVHTKSSIALAGSKKNIVSDKSMDVPMQQPTNIHPNKSLEKLTHRQPNLILKSRRNSGDERIDNVGSDGLSLSKQATRSKTRKGRAIDVDHPVAQGNTKKKRLSKVSVVETVPNSDSDFESNFEINSGGFGIRDFQVTFVPNAAQQENIQASEDESAEVC